MHWLAPTGSSPSTAVYAWVAIWGIVQALPASISDPSFEPLRPLASLAFLFNTAWLVIFAHQLFWTAFVVIIMYLWTLYALVALIRVNTVKALANITQPGVWRMLIGQHCFSANAAWVTVATLLQFEINLLEVETPLHHSASLLLSPSSTFVIDFSLPLLPLRLVGFPPSTSASPS